MSIPYLGYPQLELGDYVETNTEYRDGTSQVVAAELTFNGGFSGKVDTVVVVEEL